MTTTTPDTIGIPAEPPRPSTRFRFAIAFVVGLVAALALGVGALYAYDQQYAGRILPGVNIGGVDVSGLDPATATERLHAEYAALGEGTIVLAGPDGPIEIDYADVGRQADIEGMIAEAMALGRSGNPIDRAIADARTALRGVTITPRVTFDPTATADRIRGRVGLLRLDPEDASVTMTEDFKFVVDPGMAGRTGDPTAAIETALATLGELDAPSTLELDVPMTAIEPDIATVEAFRAKALAERLTARLVLAIEGVKKPQAISTRWLRNRTTFAPTADGGYAPTLDTVELEANLKKLAKKINKAAVSASFTTRGGTISGVTKSKNGYKLDVDDTAALVLTALAAREDGRIVPRIEPALTVTRPALTTAEAEKARPRMKRISRWTTYFPISEKNGFGANIWIPARLIDGYVVAPGATFDFWDAVGSVTRAKGYRDGGAIINGRTEPQGALAGGICSCSTTLFNAALRAGYEMGARRNHYYYIDRYPLGLDATVFISASGAKQTMSFTNDTKYPILIRGRGWSEGGSGYVRFDLYSVPNGRKVSFSRPIVRNVRPASDSVQYTSSLRPGASQRIEYPVDGKQVTVTRTVRDRKGKVIHKDTYYSNYARITGIVLIGRR
jgi:vancomycin resistance protein YoaR